eukprot:1222351-Pyramimonas_sp.AAC.1
MAKDPTICSCECRNCDTIFARVPYGATKRVRGAPKWGAYRMRAAPLGSWVELPMGPRSAWGVPKLGAHRMRAAPLGPKVEPPYGATKRVRGVPKLGAHRTRAAPLGPTLELRMGPQNV